MYDEIKKKAGAAAGTCSFYAGDRDFFLPRIPFGDKIHILRIEKEWTMEAYQSFAKVYDMFMDDIDYDAWSIYLIELLKEYGVNDGLVLELGCGTGNMTERLASAGYDMIGVDLSDDMLEAAQEKQQQSGLDILYLQQDMRRFELYGTVRAVVSVCDSLNYILEDEELLQVFCLVNNYLDPGGVFVFDLNTIYKYETLMGERTIAENREEASFIWDNYYDSESMCNEYELAIFIPEGKDGLYRKYEEVHYQRAYSLEKVKELMKKAGLEFVTAYEAFSKNAPTSESERMYIVAREHGK